MAFVVLMKTVWSVRCRMKRTVIRMVPYGHACPLERGRTLPGGCRGRQSDRRFADPPGHTAHDQPPAGSARGAARRAALRALRGGHDADELRRAAPRARSAHVGRGPRGRPSRVGRGDDTERRRALDGPTGRCLRSRCSVRFARAFTIAGCTTRGDLRRRSSISRPTRSSQRASRASGPCSLRTTSSSSCGRRRPG